MECYRGKGGCVVGVQFQIDERSERYANAITPPPQKMLLGFFHRFTIPDYDAIYVRETQKVDLISNNIITTVKTPYRSTAEPGHIPMENIYIHMHDL